MKKVEKLIIEIKQKRDSDLQILNALLKVNLVYDQAVSERIETLSKSIIRFNDQIYTLERVFEK